MAQKDKRYKNAADLIAGGYIHTFDRIFDAVPKSVVYRDMGMIYIRFQRLLESPDLFTFREVAAMARLIGCEEKRLAELIWAQRKKR